MFRKISSLLIVSFLIVITIATSASAHGKNSDAMRVRESLNIAILIQDDLTSRVGNELGVTRQFIQALPAGSRVMIGYITAGSLQVRQPFTTDLNRAANSLRIPIASTSASVSSSAGLLFQLLASLLSFLVAISGGGARTEGDIVCV